MSTNSRTLIALALDNGQVRFIDLNSGSFTHVSFIKIKHFLNETKVKIEF